LVKHSNTPQSNIKVLTLQNKNTYIFNKNAIIFAQTPETPIPGGFAPGR